MKRGDKFEVHIAGQTVAQAEVYEVAEGQVTLRIPATEVIMATATHIAPPQNIVPERSSETIITGVDRAGAQDEVAPVVVDESHIEPNTVNTGAPAVEQPKPEPEPVKPEPTPESPVDPQVLPAQSEVVSSSDIVPNSNQEN